MRDQKADGVGRILVVEDESSILTALTLLLEMEGYQVAEATNGRQGLELLASFVPDLIVTDYMMPYMNGIEMVQRLRQDPDYADVPVVLISAAPPVGGEYAELVDVCLTKPVAIDQLLAAIERLLAARPGGV